MSAAADLLSNYQHVIDSLTLTTGVAGIYDVTVDGELVFSKKAEGRHAEPGEVLELFTGIVGDIKRYGEE